MTRQVNARFPLSHSPDVCPLAHVEIDRPMEHATFIRQSGDEAITYGIVFIFGGAGLLSFYLIKKLKGEEAI